ncbi:Cas10/Cmr2 second palm domain-containing protein [Lacihabitans lacunae]|uniref:Cas10/Cmr2 second palm domain-containing protein n=1 Tax=Lacihabitans lacunae TaxID=1028214 RepID=A0ABV7YUM8_9BACT
MGNSYLYGASVQGIQSFIFQTNKLKEIGGGSELVEQICTTKFYKEAKTDKDDANIIMNAAGNIKYIFEDEDKCKAFVRTFPKLVSEFAPGITVSQAVVKLEKGIKLMDAIGELEGKLKTQRSKITNPTELGFMGIERARRTGGLGIIYKDKENRDLSTEEKHKAFEGNSSLYEKFFGKKIKNETIPFDLNEINERDKSWIAVIHADGNGLGMLLQKLAPKLNDLDDNQAKSQFRRFSQAIENATKNALQSAYSELNIKIKDKHPVRPILIGGDDVTIVIRADLALQFTSLFLEKFKQETKKELSFLSTAPLNVIDFNDGLTACAGIVYIKESYPMHYALHLAEELTKKAKKASKAISETHPPASLSFYKVQASFLESLNEIETKTLKAGDINLDFGPYFIDSQNSPKIIDLYEKLQVLEDSKNDDSKGISKLRKWISELYKNKVTADFMMKRMKEINPDFYKKMKLDDAIKDSKSIIYDVLQLKSLDTTWK